MSSVRARSKGRYDNYLDDLARLDKNGDGDVSLEEVSAFIKRAVQKEKMSLYFKWACLFMAVLLVLQSLAMFGVSFAAAKLVKDTNIKGGALTSKVTGQTLRVSDGRLVVDLGQVELAPALNASDIFTGWDFSLPFSLRRRRRAAQRKLLADVSQGRLLGTIPASPAHMACTLLQEGKKSFALEQSYGDSSDFKTVNVTLAEGCAALLAEEPGAVVIGSATLGTASYEVECSNSTCAVSLAPEADDALAATQTLRPIKCMGSSNDTCGVCNLDDDLIDAEANKNATCKADAEATCRAVCSGQKLLYSSGWWGFVDSSTVFNYALSCDCRNCFPAGATIALRGGRSKALGELEIGDEVQVVSRADGLLRFSPVYLLPHHVTGTSQAERQSFLEVRTEGGAALRLTGDHLLMLADGPAASWAARREAPARTARPGMYVWRVAAAASPQGQLHDYHNHHQQQQHHHHHHQQAQGALVLDRISGVVTVEDYGAVAPITLEGTLVVQGVAASSYVDNALLRDPAAMHAAMAPFRTVYRLAPGLLRGAHVRGGSAGGDAWLLGLYRRAAQVKWALLSAARVSA